MTYHRIMLIGKTGSGKSSQICTLEGPKIVYAFDPNTEASIEGYVKDAEVVNISPSLDELDLMPRSLKTKTTAKKPKMYEDWVDEIRAKDFSGYKWLILDSETFLSQAIMDATKHLNSGSNDGRADYMLAGSTLHMINRALVSLPLNILVMAHYRQIRNEATGRSETEINLPGSSRQTLPSMYNNIFSTYLETDKKDLTPRYYIQTVPDKDNPVCRSALKNLDPKIDVSIDFSQDNLYTQGIGRMFNS